MTLSSLKTSLFSISCTSGSRGRGGPGAVLCHFVFSKLLKYILLSADVTVAARSELLFCHHLCLFERCCITYFLHWPTATLRITTSARLHHHSRSLLPDFAVVCLQLAACPKSDCHLAPAPWRWLIVVNAAVWRMGGADSTNTHTHTQTCNVCLTCAWVEVSAGRGETSGPVKVNGCYSKLVPATGPDVWQPRSLLRRLFGRKQRVWSVFRFLSWRWWFLTSKKISW